LTSAKAVKGLSRLYGCARLMAGACGCLFRIRPEVLADYRAESLSVSTPSQVCLLVVAVAATSAGWAGLPSFKFLYYGVGWTAMRRGPGHAVLSCCLLSMRAESPEVGGDSVVLDARFPALFFITTHPPSV
jgi:hypothetical protein